MSTQLLLQAAAGLALLLPARRHPMAGRWVFPHPGSLQDTSLWPGHTPRGHRGAPQLRDGAGDPM